MKLGGNLEAVPTSIIGLIGIIGLIIIVIFWPYIFIEAIIGIFIGTCLTVFFIRLYNYLVQQRPLNKLFGNVAKDSKCEIVLSELKVNPEVMRCSKNYPFVKGEGRKVHWHPSLGVTGEGDARCLSHIYILLKEAKIKDVRMVTDDKVPGDDWASNYICIGGGASNDKSKKLLDVSKPFYKFEDTGRTYGFAIESTDGQKWEPKNGEDYGMIQKLKLNNKTMFLLAGLGPLGTAGAGRYLLDKWKNIVRRAGSSEEFGVLLKFDTTRGEQLPEKVGFDKR